MNIPGIDSKDHELAINGELTFCGVLVTYYEEISKFWNGDTKETYGMHFQELILPCFAGRPLCDFNTLDEFREIMEEIRKKGTVRSKGCEPYGESTLRHFRHLIKKVVDVAAKHGVCPNALWGSGFQETDSYEEDPYARKEKERMRLPRSIDPAIYVQILKILMTDPQQDGLQMALLLMCIFGLRNKEACSIWWEDIEEIPNHPGCYVLVVHSTAEGRNLYRKSGGKTVNMYRKLPIPPEVYAFLMARKSYILQMLEENGDQCNQSIMHLPIACNRCEIYSQCLPSQITAVGRELFRRVGFNEDAFFAADAASSEDDSGIPGMKAPTAYAFRREYCTARYSLGYSETEIAYCMGHKILDESSKRRYYSNPDNLYTLWEKAATQPLLAESTIAENSFNGRAIELTNTKNVRVVFEDFAGEVRLRVVMSEPFDAPTINLYADAAVSYDISYQKSLNRGKKESNALYEWNRLRKRGMER